MNILTGRSICRALDLTPDALNAIGKLLHGLIAHRRYQPPKRHHAGRRFAAKLMTALLGFAALTSVSWSAPTTVYPADGESLTGATQTFELYSDGLSVTNWWIYAGSTIGGTDYVNSGNLGSDQIHELSGFPEDGSTVYVRLWYRESGSDVWAFNDLTYVAQIPSTPSLVRPVPALSSRMTGRAVAFRWHDNGYGATSYSLAIGSLPGSEYYAGSFDNIFYSGEITSRSMIVDGLPIVDTAYDEDLYVALWAKRPGEDYRRVDDAIIKAYKPSIVPSISAPERDTTLSSHMTNFQWANNGVPVTKYWLYVGAKLGGKEYYDSGNLGTDTNHEVSTLPTDSSEVYVRLWYLSGNVWKYSDEQYKASGVGPEITDPVPGSLLQDSPVQFSWTDNGTGVIQWWLYSGYSPGGKNYYDSGNLGTSTTDLVDNEVPGTGEDYTVRLWFKTSPTGFWKHSDFTYLTLD